MNRRGQHLQRACRYDKLQQFMSGYSASFYARASSPQNVVEELKFHPRLHLHSRLLSVSAATEPRATDPASEENLEDDEAIEGRRKRVVVIGTGWGGMSFLKGLDTTMYDTYVVSPRNYFLFTPLLPSVTCGTVEGRSVTEPIRRLIRSNKKEATFLEAVCLKIDSKSRTLICKDETSIKVEGKEQFSLKYDYLVIAVGAESNTFGTPGVKEHCHFLKELEDAEKIRKSIVDCFETACLPGLSLEERKQVLSFVIVGGGPTGVEFAAELHDLIHEDLFKFYPQVKDLVKITLIQAADHILNTFDERISEFAKSKFQRDGVDVKTGCNVLEVNEKEVTFNDRATGADGSVAYGLVVWSTGISTRAIVTDYMKQIGQHNRRILATDEWLRVKSRESEYAVGDCASAEQRRLTEDMAYLFQLADTDRNGLISAKDFEVVVRRVRKRYPQIDVYLKHHHLKSIMDLLEECNKSSDGGSNIQLDLDAFKKALGQADSQMKSYPATAQVAAQQGEYLAKYFNHMAAQRSGTSEHSSTPNENLFQPFRYKHFGQFAPLGGAKAAAELPGDWVSIGRSTQWLWYSVYASKQVSWRTKFLVVFDWTKRLIFGRDSSQI